MPNTVNLEENLLVADMGDTKVDDLEILEFFQVGPAATIPALTLSESLLLMPGVLGIIVPLLMQKPTSSLKTKAT
jgi:hypothetical protein